MVTLILSGNKITRIYDNSVSSLIALEKLRLDYNGVELISTTAFVHNIHLSKLDLRGHRLSTFPPELGGAWRSLVSIIFGDSPVYIPTISVTNFPVLSTLTLNSIHTDLLILRELPSLKYLFAQDCNLQDFPDLSGVSGLVNVQLNRNNFTWVPRFALAGLSSLKKLSFPFGHVTHVPDLSHLVSLETLFVQENALITLPDMYDLSIMNINVANNSLVCDKMLCWIRMWDYVKSPLNVPIHKKGKCAEPTYLRGFLMDVHPVDLGCYEGKSQ